MKELINEEIDVIKDQKETLKEFKLSFNPIKNS